MIDLQKGLGLKNICDLATKEICGIFETKKTYKRTKEKICKD